MDHAMAALDRAAAPQPTLAHNVQNTGVLTLPSTEVQNEFGRVLDQAARNQDIVITRHSVPRAVLVSADRYRDLVGRDALVLESLHGQLDELYASMQTPEVEVATERGFNATPQEMGRAAVEAVRSARRASKKG
jgi:prevent-host-death family protein